MRRLYELAIKGINAEIEKHKGFSIDTWMTMSESEQKVVIDTIAELRAEREGYVAKLDELTRPPIRPGFAEFSEKDHDDIANGILNDIEFDRFSSAFDSFELEINSYIIEPLEDDIERLDSWLEENNFDNLTEEETIIREQVSSALETLENVKGDVESHLGDIEYYADQGAYVW